VEPFLVLVALPAALGALAELWLRDAKRASFVAGLAALAALLLCVQLREPGAGWHWVAALLASPLPIAVAVGTAMLLYGRFGRRF
jgi:hypothetical protein